MTFMFGKTGQKPCKTDYTYPFFHENSGDRYVGEVKDGFWHGKGTYYFKDGRKFEGLYSSGSFFYGAYTWVGEFEAGETRDKKEFELELTEKEINNLKVQLSKKTSRVSKVLEGLNITKKTTKGRGGKTTFTKEAV